MIVTQKKILTLKYDKLTYLLWIELMRQWENYKIKRDAQKDLKDDVDKIFSLVDMRAREGLRED